MKPPGPGETTRKKHVGSHLSLPICLILIALSSVIRPPSINKTQTLAFHSTKNASSSSSTRDDIKQQQVENFRKGNGLIMDIHLTHHAGTYFCKKLRSVLTAPDFACMGVRNGAYLNLTDAQVQDFKQNISSKPWNYAETHDKIPRLKALGFSTYFQEFGSPLTLPNRTRKSLHDTDWEHPQLVSVFIARDPIERLLSPSPFMVKKGFGHEDTRTHEQWWMYANMSSDASFSHKVDNFNLQFLTESFDCCQGAHTDRKHLYAAQQLARRWTFILDQACLDDNLEEFGRILGLELQLVQHPANHHQKSVQERIQFPDVYDFLVQKNQLDIEFYHWAKTKSLVRCDR